MCIRDRFKAVQEFRDQFMKEAFGEVSK